MALIFHKKPVKLLVVTHHHRHGDSQDFAWVNMDFTATEEWIVQNMLSDMYEPHRDDEWLDVFEIVPGKIPDFTS